MEVKFEECESEKMGIRRCISAKSLMTLILMFRGLTQPRWLGGGWK
jgi:hypothetical protein